MTLGDSFPISERRKLLRGKLVPGCVLYLHCDFTSPPKEKYLVLVCDEPCLLSFIINSEISQFIQRHTEMRRSQVRVNAKDHRFLNHDSFINCTETISRFSVEDVEEQVLGDMGRIKGRISADVLDEVIAATKAARTLASREMGWILGALERAKQVYFTRDETH